MNQKEVEDRRWESTIGFLVWLGSVFILTLGAIVGVVIYGRVDDWEGNIEGSLLPLVVAAMVSLLFLTICIHLYGKYVIVPFENRIEVNS